MQHIYIAICFLALSGLATSAATAAHGGNYFPKLLVAAVHTLILPTVAPIFWLIFRRHKQADAELNIIAGTGTYEAVKEAYYFQPLSGIMAKVIQYCHEHPWRHLEDNSDGQRAQQEICGGFVLGVFLSLPTALLIALL